MGRPRLGHLIVIALLLTPARAGAQDLDTPPWFVGGLGGVTFGTVTSGAVGGQVGFRVAPNLFLIGEVGRMRNVLPADLQEDLDDLLDLFEAELGVPLRFEVSLPATYVFGGLRWMQAQRSLAPFLEAGAGAGRISFSIDRASFLGIDLSDEIEDAAGDDAATKFLFTLGGGLSIRPSAHWLIDLGFRFTRIATEDPAINSSLAYIAAKFAPRPAR